MVQSNLPETSEFLKEKENRKRQENYFLQKLENLTRRINNYNEIKWKNERSKLYLYYFVTVLIDIYKFSKI